MNVITLENNIYLYSCESFSLNKKYKKRLCDEINTFLEIYNFDIVQELHDASDLKIVNINGMKLENTVYWEYDCGHCGSTCSLYASDGINYYCYDCNIYVCAQCFYNCESHEIRNNYIKGSVYCNICDKILAVLEPRYSRSANDYDVCFDCSNEYNNIGLFYINDDINLGSLSDWIKILKDDDDNFILCNLNSMSNYYKRIAFLLKNSDDDYVLFTTKKTELNSILTEYLEYTHNHFEYSDEEQYKLSPIVKMANDIADLKYHGFLKD